MIYVYKPEVYNLKNIKAAYEILNQNFALYIPTILDLKDFALLEEILKELPNNIYLYSNNIGILNLASYGYNIIASPLINTKNTFAIKCLNSLNITTVCASIEADFEFADKNNLITFESGEFPLMTFAHCPYKNIFKNDCNSCKYDPKLSLLNPNLGTYKIKRTVLKNCQFELTKTLSNKTGKFNVKNLNY